MIRRTRVRLTAIDRDGNEGIITFIVVPSLQLGDIEAEVVAEVVPRLQAIIDATIVAVRVEHTAKIESPATATGNLLIDRLFVAWRNEDDYLATLQIPAISSDIEYTSDSRYGVAVVGDEFDAIQAFIEDWVLYDRQGVRINGTIEAACIII